MRKLVNKPLTGKKVFVGLSGGVDSAVTAALLKAQGASVYGVFIKGYYPPYLSCTWAKDRKDAMRVAARLHIPFTTLDASAEYKSAVIDYLVAEYKAGRTPNPDIMCNREVKFGAFYQFAKEKQADYIATGHYAQTMQTKDGVQLLRGIDSGKDQSYFLWAVPQEALEHTLFPLGTYEKKEVRRLARDFTLPVAEKRDSQGICFLGSVSIDDFLRAEFEVIPGIAVDTLGTHVGTHEGAVLYTLGERVVLTDAAPGPWYVVAKDIRTNTIVVANEPYAPTPTKHIALRDTNWFVPRASHVSVEAQYRYHGPVIKGVIDMNEGLFTPTHPITESIASGQSLVLYRGEECIGGGIII